MNLFMYRLCILYVYDNGQSIDSDIETNFALLEEKTLVRGLGR